MFKEYLDSVGALEYFVLNRSDSILEYESFIDLVSADNYVSGAFNWYVAGYNTNTHDSSYTYWMEISERWKQYRRLHEN